MDNNNHMVQLKLLALFKKNTCTYNSILIMHIQYYVNTVIQGKLPNCPTHVVMQTTERLEVIM